MYKSSLITTTATTAIALIGLTACSGSSEDAAAEAPQASEQTQPDEGVTVEPGFASCTFNNELDDHEWDGSGSYSDGTLETAEVRETDEAYEVTMTGDFFDPAAPFLEEGVLTLNLQFDSADFEDGFALQTSYNDGEIDFSGVVTSDEQSQEALDQDTNASLEEGAFTATYPKGVPAIDEVDPELWMANVYFDVRESTANGISESSGNGSFRCNDGRSWDWQPLGAQ